MPPRETAKETLISIVIAFALAFVFRAFVIEAYIIPTGSMAPTLLGAHMRFTGPRTGADWPVSPWYFADPQFGQEPFPLQGSVQYGHPSPIIVNDPISGEEIRATDVPTRSGDRILVLKYLYALREPARFDVVVFKNPSLPGQNYIKRLIGLPGEMVALVDGDVFVRPTSGPVSSDKKDDWDLPGWTIARKPMSVQRATWQPLFDSAKTSTDATAAGASTSADRPWVTQGEQWTLRAGGVMEYTGSGPTRVQWNTQAKFIPALREASGTSMPAENREITDRYPFNQIPRPLSKFPVSDVRLRAGVQPTGDASKLVIRAVVAARGHEFVGEITGGRAVVKMRPATLPGQPEAAWKELGSGTATLRADQVDDVEFWHSDQYLRLLVHGHVVAEGGYEWSPAERVRAATGRTIDQMLDLQKRDVRNIFADTSVYVKPQVRWEIDGAPVTLMRVGLDRDLFYQPDTMRGSTSTKRYATATHPDSTLTLGDDQFFCCGDNSPQSSDGRLWGEPEAWVSKLMDQRGMVTKDGVVARDLMLGKAFFVYFPSLTGNGPVPVPDFGRMRFIR